MNLSRPLVVLDLEATGIWIEKDKIIEIAMIKTQVDGSKETYEKKVNPGIPIPAIITELTGISDQDVEEAPTFKDIAQEVVEFLGEADLGGFNIDRFDLPLLEREIIDSGLKFDRQVRRVFDAQKVYHLNEKRDLTAAYKFYCEKDLANAHTALADTQATLEIIESQSDKYCQGTADDLLQFDYEPRDEFFGGDRRFRWWNGKLYMMFGKYARKYSLQEVARKDRGYLEWIVSADFSNEIKTLVEGALNGQFPVRETKPKL